MDLKNIDLNGLCNALEEYNSQFGIGSILGHIIFGRRGLSEEEVETNLEIEVMVNKELSLSQIESEYRDILKAVGLNLERVRAGATIFTGGEQIPGSVARINLAQGGLFVNYLAALDKTFLSPIQAQSLRTIASNFLVQLTWEYQLDVEDERVLVLFAALADIISHYNRLGLQDSAQELTTYLEIARNGYLREYIMVDRAQLFAEVGGNNFGPSKWQTDMNPDHYRERWERTLEILDTVSQNPRASEFAHQLREHLRASSMFARTDLPKIGHIRQYLKDFTQVLNEVDGRLN